MTTVVIAPVEAPPRTAGPRWRAVASWVSLVLLTLLVVAVWPQAWGGSTSLTIVSGHSMDPTFATGDLVIGRTGPAHVGDVIVYEPDDVDGRVVHRIVGGNAHDGWIMRGDNNSWDDIWTPTSQDVVGVVRVHLPRVGLAIQGLTSPTAWIAYAAILGGWLLWPTREEQDEEEDDDSVEG